MTWSITNSRQSLIWWHPRKPSCRFVISHPGNQGASLDAFLERPDEFWGTIDSPTTHHLYRLPRFIPQVRDCTFFSTNHKKGSPSWWILTSRSISLKRKRDIQSAFFISRQENLNQKAIWFSQLICVWWCENSISTLLFYTLMRWSGEMRWKSVFKKRKKVSVMWKNAFKVYNVSVFLMILPATAYLQNNESTILVGDEGSVNIFIPRRTLTL